MGIPYPDFPEDGKHQEAVIFKTVCAECVAPGSSNTRNHHTTWGSIQDHISRTVDIKPIFLHISDFLQPWPKVSGEIWENIPSTKSRTRVYKKETFRNY